MSKDAIELAREYGVDIKQLKLMRSRTPHERLQYMQAMAQFIVKGRKALQKQKERAKHG